MEELNPVAKIYTIGYGNRKIEDFLALLRRLKIEVVADVRRFPTSKRAEFVKENLREELSKRGIGYVHFRGLGGYRGGYRTYMRTEDFKRELRGLMELAKRKRTAIMCLEEYPSGCHRRHIAAALRRRRWEVLHIVRKGELTSSLRSKRRSRCRAARGGSSRGPCRVRSR
jgi:uncharacterized protein (DUF488 family)